MVTKLQTWMAAHRLDLAFSTGPVLVLVTTLMLGAGRTGWLLVALSALSALAAASFFGRDIDRLRELTARVRESEDRFRHAFDDAPIGMALLALDGRWLRVNHALSELLGVGEEALAGVEETSLLSPEHRAAARERLQRAANGATPIERAELGWTDAEGNALRVVQCLSLVKDSAGAPFYLVSQVEDVTEQRRAEEALVRSEERLRAAIEGGSDVFFVLTCARDEAGAPVDFTLGAANRRGQRLLDRLGRGALGEGCLGELIPALHSQGAIAEWLRVYTEGEAVERELPLELPGGARALVQYQVLPIGDGVAIVGRDVSARRLSEEQLQKAQKIEALGRLAGGVAHDFNNLLAVITCTATLLRDDIAEDDPRREDAETIRAAATRGAALTRKLLTFSRRQSVEHVDVALNDLVEKHERALRDLLPQRIALATSLEAHDVVRGDAALLEQVLTGLVQNARDAIGGAGTITVATSDADVDEAVASRFGTLREGRYVRLCVEDTGAGMSEETLQRLFEPFFTTKRASGCAGLGLSSVYGIVTQAGGHVDVRSRVGVGSSFSVYLPRIERARDTVALSTRRSTGGRARETLLVVDDEELVRRSLARLLTREGYTVIEAENGLEALAVLEARGQAVDLMITDAIMPKMGGRALIEEVSRLRPSLPILMVCGCTDKELAGGELSGNGRAFLTKPFEPPVLLSALRDLLESNWISCPAPLSPPLCAS
jgi:PAS domain S-box-containing protein